MICDDASLNMAATGSRSYIGGWHVSISVTVHPKLLQIYTYVRIYREILGE